MDDWHGLVGNRDTHGGRVRRTAARRFRRRRNCRAGERGPDPLVLSHLGAQDGETVPHGARQRDATQNDRLLERAHQLDDSVFEPEPKRRVAQARDNQIEREPEAGHAAFVFDPESAAGHHPVTAGNVLARTRPAGDSSLRVPSRGQTGADRSADEFERRSALRSHSSRARSCEPSLSAVRSRAVSRRRDCEHRGRHGLRPRLERPIAGTLRARTQRRARCGSGGPQDPRRQPIEVDPQRDVARQRRR